MRLAQPLRIDHWPRAILHLDADNFFASVEQAVHPEWRGKPVVTGLERGIVSAASQEAKLRGIRRGVPLKDVKRLCPECILIPSDYETYGLYSRKIFALLREYTPAVEEHSIDEAFADISGMRRLYHCSYPLIAQKIKDRIERELGLTVSIGVSLSKSLAKLASKFRKPSGLTAVPGKYLHHLLGRTPLAKVWGFGPNTVALLTKSGLKTALDYVERPLEFAQGRLGKIGTDLWRELRGDVAYPVDPSAKETYQSIGKTKTFLPPSSDKDYLLAQMFRNLEEACAKARRYGLAAERLSVFLKRQDFTSQSQETTFSRPTAATLETNAIAKDSFEAIFRPGVLYRATGVVLSGLRQAKEFQWGLFEDPLRAVKAHGVSEAIDQVNEQYGRQTVRLSASLLLQDKLRRKSDGQPEQRKSTLKGEAGRRRLNLPMVQVRV